MLEDVITPTGPYRLRLMARSGTWQGSLPGNRVATANQRPDGRVVVRAPDDEALATARFMLALDDDTSDFHARFARDPLIGPSARLLRRLPAAPPRNGDACRPPRDVRTADRGTTRSRDRAGGPRVRSARRSSLEPALRRASLRSSYAGSVSPSNGPPSLARLGGDARFERLRGHPETAIVPRLGRERGIGPWSVGVISLEGLGRYDRGLVGDLALVKLHVLARGPLGRGGRDRGPPRALRGVAGPRRADADARLVAWPGPGRRSARPRRASRRRRERRAA